MDYYLKTSKLSVGYNGKPIVKDIEFGVSKGEILTLIGPNGSGKSTILKSITRQLEVVSGTVFIGENDLKDINYKDMAKKVSVLLTERVRPELLTCYDVVALGRYPYTGKMGILSKEDEKEIFESMEMVGILSLKDRDFQKLSDGQKQRVLLARAICQKPEVLVLDEPTSYLDIKYKIELLEVLKRMAKTEKVAVILSLHEIELAGKISDKVLCVKGENISYYGTPEEVFKKNIIMDLFDIDEYAFKMYFSKVDFYG